MKHRWQIYPRCLKRACDFVLSSGLCLLLAPLMLLLVVFLALFHRGGNVFFLQERAGCGGKVFRIIKFRTMDDGRDQNGELLPDGQRITPVGRFLRRTSIDEIPQLVNVLKGDMALVGPRPLFPEYLPMYSAEHARRHEVRPGITGWAQCHGRNGISWEEKLDMDVWYVDHVSFSTDCKVILRTVKTVLCQTGIDNSAYLK